MTIFLSVHPRPRLPFRANRTPRSVRSESPGARARRGFQTLARVFLPSLLVSYHISDCPSPPPNNTLFEVWTTRAPARPPLHKPLTRGPRPYLPPSEGLPAGPAGRSASPSLSPPAVRKTPSRQREPSPQAAVRTAAGTARKSSLVHRARQIELSFFRLHRRSVPPVASAPQLKNVSAQSAPSPVALALPQPSSSAPRSSGQLSIE